MVHLLFKDVQRSSEHFCRSKLCPFQAVLEADESTVRVSAVAVEYVREGLAEEREDALLLIRS